jgi:alanyl-tRNA synthetase
MTQKVYYIEPYLKKVKAKIIDIKDNKIVLDKTIAYAEGGGQEGDRGYLIINGKKIPFFDTKKGPGRTLFLKDFPTIQVENPIYHFVNEEDVKYFKIGDEVEVEIDVDRRAKLSIAHSAIHLVLMCIEKYFPGFEEKIYGAKIKEDGARLDFRTEYKFNQEDIKKIEECVNELIQKDLPINQYHHPDEKEAWYWECNGWVCPCGGTHIENTGIIGEVKVKRKNLGKTGQRISITIQNSKLFRDKFYENSKA